MTRVLQAVGNAPSRDTLERIFRTTFAIRQFETEGIKLYRQGLIRGYFHPYLGQEGIAAGACAALRRGDYIASTHRGHGHCIAWGADINKMMAELLQKRTGYCRGLRRVHAYRRHHDGQFRSQRHRRSGHSARGRRGFG